jgi:hypothetical protein
MVRGMRGEGTVEIEGKGDNRIGWMQTKGDQ